VFGILLAFGMFFPNSYIYLFFAIPVKAKYFVIGYGVLELYFGFTSNGNVAHFAHLGGMIFGYLLIRYWRRRRQIYY
jgi:membrane associated rhomboid family serine protease